MDGVGEVRREVFSPGRATQGVKATPLCPAKDCRYGAKSVILHQCSRSLTIEAASYPIHEQHYKYRSRDSSRVSGVVRTVYTWMKIVTLLETAPNYERLRWNVSTVNECCSSCHGKMPPHVGTEPRYHVALLRGKTTEFGERV
ncbi:hypothetical protein TNCV_629201 [Trichonephila clavipes]|nr:hypothetical protein TNCV_629201 [Trichonephila clavipes]